jgi:hypothetical protein
MRTSSWRGRARRSATRRRPAPTVGEGVDRPRRSRALTAAAIHGLDQRAEAGRASLAAAERHAERAADRIESARGRLHSDRLDAYRAFTVAFNEYLDVEEDVAGAWTRRNYRADLLDVNDPDTVKWFDLEDADFRRHVGLSVEASLRVRNALALLELVASAPVASAAHNLRSQADAAGQSRFALGNKPGEVTLEAWTAFSYAKVEVTRAHDALIDAIRAELQLET